MNKLLAATLCALLAACSSTPPTQYFLLPGSHYRLPQHNGKEIALRVVLSEPLTQNGLVYQTDALNLNMAKQNQWAAPLDQALAARFANELNSGQRHYRFVPASRSTSETALTLYIETFNGSYTGHTQIRGYSQWQNGRGTNFSITTPQKGDGYAAMVQSLSQGITQAAQTVLHGLN